VSIAAGSSFLPGRTRCFCVRTVGIIFVVAAILTAGCSGGFAGQNEITFQDEQNWSGYIDLPAGRPELGALTQSISTLGVEASSAPGRLELSGAGGPLQLRRLVYGELRSVLNPFAEGTALTLAGGIQAGETITLTLEAIPSSGYSWQVTSLGPAALAVSGEVVFQQVSAQAGAPEHQLVTVTAQETGQAALSLVYRRPWEPHTAAQHLLTITAPHLALLGDLTIPDLTSLLPPGLELQAPFSQDVLSPPADQVLDAGSLPARFDWRDLGKTPPVRDQRNCGSCWAFATVGAFESAIMIKDNVPSIDLSEQYLVSCNKDNWSCLLGGGTAHPYHMNKLSKDNLSGAVLESSFPYQAKDVACGGPYDHPYKLSDWNYINYGAADVNAIKQAIYTRGPVKASVCVGNAFQGYRGGIFTTNEASACGGGSNTNHAVVLVGWDDTQGPNGIWFLRNSWGTYWGEGGYMRIDRTVSNVGANASYVVYDGINPNPGLNKRLFLPLVNR